MQGVQPRKKPLRINLKNDENKAITLLNDFVSRSDFGKLYLVGREFNISMDLIYHRGPVLGNGNGGKVFQTSYEGIALARKDIQIVTHPSDKLVTNLIREVVTTQNCNDCPFVVQYFGYYIHKRLQMSNIYIFMERVPFSASDIISTMKEKQKVDPGLKIPEYVLGRVVCSVVHALRFLKEKLKMMHRDIKPGNILIDLDGRVKVCDFGICGVLVESKAETKCGSIPYLAPERFEMEPYTVKSDIWALGVTVVELATLINPYYQVGAQEYDIMNRILYDDSPTLSKNEFSALLIDLIDNLLKKDPNARPAFGKFEEFGFFSEHDIPYSFIGSGLRPPRGNVVGNTSRESVGLWIDKIMLG